MSRHQFQQLKDDLKSRSAGAFIDGFYYFNDRPSETNRHRPSITVVCVFQRVPEGSNWTRPSQLLTPAQNLAEVARNPNAPRVPIEMLLESEQQMGWTAQMFENYLTRIADIPLQFLCFVIYHKLWPAVSVDTASEWTKVILQPQFWRNQWLFYETNNGRLADNPRIASKVYSYFRRNVNPLAPIQTYVEEISVSTFAMNQDWLNWQRLPNFERHLITLLRALLLSDTKIVDAGFHQDPGGVDLDFFNAPLSWNTIGSQGGSDLEYPHATQLRNMDSIRFENGLIICQSTWYIAQNYKKLYQNIFDNYWLWDNHDNLSSDVIADNWRFWLEDFQHEWNDIFLHHSIFQRGRSRNYEDFIGVNPNVPNAIAHRNEGTLSLLRSMYPNYLPPRNRNPERSRPTSSRLMGRGVIPISSNFQGALEPAPAADNVTSLSDYVFFHMLHNL